MARPSVWRNKRLSTVFGIAGTRHAHCKAQQVVNGSSEAASSGDPRAGFDRALLSVESARAQDLAPVSIEAIDRALADLNRLLRSDGLGGAVGVENGSWLRLWCSTAGLLGAVLERRLDREDESDALDLIAAGHQLQRLLRDLASQVQRQLAEENKA